ncbi:MAG: FtsQ-type POTRA domain-containing protein [Candidatus Eisenbacteria bacterium]|nr:FtsQ-type POTRA domain-containing protein [Candidatus Eisenbacteria bacterium]
MADQFDLYSTRKRRPLPDVDPAVRKRFESLDLGRSRRPIDRLRSPKDEEIAELSIPRGDASPRESSHGLRWTLLGLAVVTIAVVVHGFVSGSPLWTAQNVRVVGNRAVESEPVLSALGIEPGVSWWHAFTADQDAVLDAYPRVDDVAIRYHFPRGLVVRVSERTPMFRWLGEPARVVAEDGTLLAAVASLDPSDLPCLSAPGIDPGLPGRTLELPGSGDYWEQLQRVRNENTQLWTQISQVQYEGERRFRVFFRDPKRVVLWDPYLNAHLWSRIPLVLGDLAERGLGTDAVLDLRFRDRIVVRVPEEEWYRLKDAEAGDGLEGRGAIGTGDAKTGTPGDRTGVRRSSEEETDRSVDGDRGGRT